MKTIPQLNSRASRRRAAFAAIVSSVVLGASASPVAPTAAPGDTLDSLPVRISWGHRSPGRFRASLRFLTNEVVVAQIAPQGFERSDRLVDGICQSQAGAGDVDGLNLTLRFAPRSLSAITNLQSIWRHLMEHGDRDAAARLRSDPGFRPDPRKLTVQLNAEGTRGFSVTVDQLLTTRAFWVPELDVFLSAGGPPVSFEAHQQALRAFRGQRILDRVQREPEASYEQFTALWEDMGSPAYRNPHSVGPGHVVGITWDSALYKFGIDRGAGVWTDYGKLDPLRSWFDFGDLSRLSTRTWRGQHLTDGLPVISTRFEDDGVRYDVEQFAYPLEGPPRERRGDIPMVLMQQVRVSNLEARARTLTVHQTLQRGRPVPGVGVIGAVIQTNTPGVRQESQVVGPGTNHVTFALDVPANGACEFVVKLPSPEVSEATNGGKLLALDYTACRAETLKFWSDYLARGAQFVVPEDAVNTLFRANLWHALRLPRRHGGAGPKVQIDLPYSNFAYDQKGTPWPVNQAIYVDYMLYDLRGYPDISAEELAAMYRNNQEPNGHVGGFANWGVYTPSMIYAVAKHFLLSGDRASFEALLPQTLKALDWCLGEMRQASERTGPGAGLVLAPLNDLSHDPKAWAFNQAYLFAGPDLLARALAETRHPRAAECRAAAQAMFDAVQRGYAHASMRSPLVQLRDHTWMPYVPGDALTPRRLLEIWYPTDIDSGPLHLSRLKALDPNGDLTTFLLHDHEDNLFFNGWGMANEPVYNQHATAYLLRDEPKAAIRAFYSMMACAFSHSTFEPVEHRWGWGQYFGPPSTDGAWFELYRQMLIHERDDGSLLLGQATPRKWLENGKQIRVERAPTYHGPLSFTVESRVSSGEIRVTLEPPARKRPSALLVRLRHPAEKPMRSVRVNGRAWRDFDAGKEWVRIPSPGERPYAITVRY